MPSAVVSVLWVVCIYTPSVVVGVLWVVCRCTACAVSGLCIYIHHL